LQITEIHAECGSRAPARARTRRAARPEAEAPEQAQEASDGA
jgi:hypothetical protein